jgi:hypothetical protein
MQYAHCLGELCRDFTTEEIGEQNKDEENKSPTPTEMWKLFVQRKREWKF